MKGHASAASSTGRFTRNGLLALTLLLATAVVRAASNMYRGHAASAAALAALASFLVVGLFDTLIDSPRYLLLLLLLVWLACAPKLDVAKTRAL